MDDVAAAGTRLFLSIFQFVLLFFDPCFFFLAGNVELSGIICVGSWLLLMLLMRENDVEAN